MNKKNKTREQAINYIVKTFNLLPYQEYIVREMWRTKSYSIPVRGDGWSCVKSILALMDVVLMDVEKDYYVYRGDE